METRIVTRIPPFKLWTIGQLSKLTGESVFKTALFLRTNHVPIERRGRTRVVRHAALEAKWPDVADAIRFGGDDDE
jgi:hypothetical protein